LFRTAIAGRVHLGVRLHHLVGDHLAQTAILRAITAATHGAPFAGPPERSFANAARRLAARADREHETCAAFWEAQAIAPPDVAARPVTAALAPTVRRRRLAGVRADRAPSELLLGWLAAAAAALETTFAIQAPVVLCLVSLREDPVSLGFQTVAAPIALTAARVAGGRPLPALLDAVLATRRHAVIGLEEIRLAAGLDRARLPFLINVVDLAADDERWWRDHLLDTPTEGCKSELDLTILRAGDHLELTVTTRFAAPVAEALLDALVAGRPAP
jgi:hypothetical protein